MRTDENKTWAAWTADLDDRAMLFSDPSAPGGRLCK